MYYCLHSDSSDSSINIVILDKSSLCLLFYTFEKNSSNLTLTQIHNCKPRNPEIDVLGVKYSPLNKNIYYVADQESIIMYDRRTPFQIVETFKGNT